MQWRTRPIQGRSLTADQSKHLGRIASRAKVKLKDKGDTAMLTTY
ncbi:MAG: hypothetical protein V7K14_10515 [Nostoc sp.]